MPRAFNLAKLVATGFEDASRGELDKAFELKYGRPPESNRDMITLRAELVAVWAPDADGLVPSSAPLPTSLQKPPTPAPLTKALGRIPNLRTSGKWEGRARRVTIHAMDQMSKSTGMKVGWEGIMWTIAYDQTVDMPWPFWQSLKNTDFLDDRSMDVTKWERGEDGQTYAVRTPRWIKTVNFTDHGDVPGTENLPEGYAQYFIEQARKTGCFKDLSRSALTMVYNYIYDPEGAEFFRDMEDQDIRLKIATRLGPDAESYLVNELYPEAEAG